MDRPTNCININKAELNTFDRRGAGINRGSNRTMGGGRLGLVLVRVTMGHVYCIVVSQWNRCDTGRFQTHNGIHYTLRRPCLQWNILFLTILIYAKMSLFVNLLIFIGLRYPWSAEMQRAADKAELSVLFLPICQESWPRQCSAQKGTGSSTALSGLCYLSLTLWSQHSADNTLSGH